MDAPNVFSVDWHALGFDRDDFTPDAFNANKRIFWNEEGSLPNDFPIARCEPDMNWFDGTLNGRLGGGGRWFWTFSQVIGRFCDQVRTPETAQLLEFAAPLMCLDIMPSSMWKERDMGDVYYYAVISPAKVRQLIEVGSTLPFERLRTPLEDFINEHLQEWVVVPTWDNFYSYVQFWLQQLNWAAGRNHGIVCGV